MKKDFRKYIGPPSTVGPVESVVLLLSIAAFVLAMIGTTSPAWRTFATENANFSIGLWSACKDNLCFYAWTQASPIVAFNEGAMHVGWYFQTNTPTLVATAEAFLLIGIVLHIMSCCCYAGGPLASAIALAFPAAFYTAGMSCAVHFFLHPSMQPTTQPIKLEWGYAAECLFVALILIWAAVFAYFCDWVLRVLVWRRRDVKDLEAMAESDATALEVVTAQAPEVVVVDQEEIKKEAKEEVKEVKDNKEEEN